MVFHPAYHFINRYHEIIKVQCAFSMVIVSLLPHAEFIPNDHREDAAHFIFTALLLQNLLYNSKTPLAFKVNIATQHYT